MKTWALLLFLQELALGAHGADPLPARPSFTLEPLKLRAPEVERLYIAPATTASFDVSAEANRNKLEADLSRFRAMNGRDPIEITHKIEPPSRVFRFLNALLPSGSVFGKNPNAPPSAFTR